MQAVPHVATSGAWNARPAAVAVSVCCSRSACGRAEAVGQVLLAQRVRRARTLRAGICVTVQSISSAAAERRGVQQRPVRSPVLDRSALRPRSRQQTPGGRRRRGRGGGRPAAAAAAGTLRRESGLLRGVLLLRVVLLRRELRGLELLLRALLLLLLLAVRVRRSGPRVRVRGRSRRRRRSRRSGLAYIRVREVRVAVALLIRVRVRRSLALFRQVALVLHSRHPFGDGLVVGRHV